MYMKKRLCRQDSGEDKTPGNTDNAVPVAEKKRSPSDFLKSVLGRPAVVKLNSGIEYRGVLACLDGYLNIAMEQTQEYGLDGQLKATYGDCFIRGNNVLYISAQKRK
ncbi:LSM domain containing protein [Nitzschia inconspicua]|uniref:LSM domain containing protein n=1 Tax=Nitzschia inconspicua TaxID=303405 RepID=A0A9K3KN07_9STRA|nr:LSM domain containing protein [Nitzschia inconspicua]